MMERWIYVVAVRRRLLKLYLVCLLYRSYPTNLTEIVRRITPSINPILHPD